ncbi:alpha/beta hydrolase fold domain-containing protein [Arthrobacter sp. zg-Y1143]|uniref:alpha/beta hydrolase fold domain-containing protein n=1 Tax=Arthrobacter sp. zg-Y1143 TaxID=3049065 RepID=UPI0024C249B8|nr:alpha/beta hydrolase fold domain-containing protein [Arthrobacter sp. zg-Y1143]MDK1327469.1 alpha/beta hydrolase fold domain-containing protein [Arthrobacter sp. zg-Y1143]
MESVADAELAAWLAVVRSGGSSEPSPEQIRQLRVPRRRPAGPAVQEVRDLMIPGTVPLAARLYRPHGSALPLTVFVHGGGFVFGGLESHDRLCRRLSLLAGTAVLAVDYRLAPEHPAPAGVDDVVRALRWAADRPPALGPLLPGAGLAGDSAGGLIAFLAARSLAGTAAEPRLLLLAYPNADLTLSLPGGRTKGEGWGLSVRDLAFYISQWVPAAERLAEFSPVHLLRADLARGQHLPVRTLLATAEHDPLREEGQMLARELARGGTAVDYVPHSGHLHGFLTLDAVSPAARTAGDALLQRYGAALVAVSG